MRLFQPRTRSKLTFATQIDTTETTTYLQPERSIDIVRLTLKKKDGSTTRTIHIAKDYYYFGQLFAASPECWPVLDSVAGIRHSYTGEMGNLHDVTISIFGRTHFDQYGTSFADLRDMYQFHGALVECLYFTDDMTALNVRMTAEITRVQSANASVLTLNARTRWFKDVEVSKRAHGGIFADIDPGAESEYAPIVFGENVIVPTFYFRGNISSSIPSFRLFTGWTFQGHAMNGFNTLYVKNQTPDLYSADWFPVSLASDPNKDVNGATKYTYKSGPWAGIATPWTYRALNAGSYGKRIAADSATGLVLTGFRFKVAVYDSAGTPAAGDGDLAIVIEPSVQSPGIGFQQLTGKALARVPIDLISTDTELLVMLQQPIAMPPGNVFGIYVEWSNTNYQPDYFYFLAERDTIVSSEDYLVAYKGVFDSSHVGSGWQKQTISSNYGLGLQSFAMGVGTNNYVDQAGAEPNLYSYQHLAARDFSSDTLNANSAGYIHEGNAWLADVDGLEDNDAGSYTGSANAVMKTPIDIARFILFGHGIGPEIPSTRLDSDSFDSVRSSQQATATQTVMAFAIFGRRFAEELVRDICRYSRAIIYPTRAGKIAAQFDDFPDTTPDEAIGQSRYQDEIEFISFDDADYGQVVNDFRFNFDLDMLNEPKAAALLRRAETDKYSQLAYIDEAGSSSNNAALSAACERSQALYGRRQMHEDIPYFQADSSVERLLAYLATTKTAAPKTAVFKLLRKDWYSLFHFDIIDLSHFEIPATGGNSHFVKSHDGAGAAVERYYQGVPVYRHSYGELHARIIDIAEQDDQIQITIQSQETL